MGLLKFQQSMVNSPNANAMSTKQGTIMQSQFGELRSPHSIGAGVKSPSTVGMVEHLEVRLAPDTFGEGVLARETAFE